MPHESQENRRMKEKMAGELKAKKDAIEATKKAFLSFKTRFAAVLLINQTLKDQVKSMLQGLSNNINSFFLDNHSLSPEKFSEKLENEINARLTKYEPVLKQLEKKLKAKSDKAAKIISIKGNVATLHLVKEPGTLEQLALVLQRPENKNVTKVEIVYPGNRADAKAWERGFKVLNDQLNESSNIKEIVIQDVFKNPRNVTKGKEGESIIPQALKDLTKQAEAIVKTHSSSPQALTPQADRERTKTLSATSSPAKPSSGASPEPTPTRPKRS